MPINLLKASTFFELDIINKCLLTYVNCNATGYSALCFLFSLRKYLFIVFTATQNALARLQAFVFIMFVG